MRSQDRLLLLSVFMWSGVVLGGNLIAPTAKFRAPSLALSTALEVGRATFRMMLIAELVLCAALYLLLALRGKQKPLWFLPAAALAAQWFVVMPPLDVRTLAIIGGQNPGPSNLHIYYVALEFLKLIGLLAIGWTLAGSTTQPKT